MEIDYLGKVDGFNIYHVPSKGDGGAVNPQDWEVEGFVFSVPTHVRIIGIKNLRLYTLGKMIHETNINIEKLYKVIPLEYKKQL